MSAMSVTEFMARRQGFKLSGWESDDDGWAEPAPTFVSVHMPRWGASSDMRIVDARKETLKDLVLALVAVGVEVE